MFSLSRFTHSLLFFSLLLTLVFKLPADESCYYDFPLRYRIFDIGETDLPSELLSKRAWPVSFSPRINAKGHIIWNTSNGGVFWDRCNQRRTYSYHKRPVFFHDLNDKGLVLSAVNLENGRNWFLWPSSIWKWQESVVMLPFKSNFQNQYYLKAFNNNGVIVGIKKEGSLFSSFFYTSSQLEQNIPYGPVWDVNDNGFIVGRDECDPEKKPFLYQVKSGWIPFSDEADINRPCEKVIFEDSVLTSDNTVFGSYLSNKNCFPYSFNYEWNFEVRLFISYDLDEMKISAVNCIRTLVGTSRGQAVVSYKGSAPLNLSYLANAPHIHLIEATDINDLGEIVAYGLIDDEMHIFLLIPE